QRAITGSGLRTAQDVVANDDNGTATICRSVFFIHHRQRSAWQERSHRRSHIRPRLDQVLLSDDELRLREQRLPDGISQLQGIWSWRIAANRRRDSKLLDRRSRTRRER